MAKLEREVYEKTVQVYLNHGRNAAATAKVLGIGATTIKDRLVRAKELGILKGSASPSKVSSKKGTMSLDEFKSQFDNYTRIRKAIEESLRSLEDNQVVKDVDFRIYLCGIGSTNGWRQVAEEEEFSKYQFQCDGKIWWATEKTVQEVLRTVSKARSL